MINSNLDRLIIGYGSKWNGFTKMEESVCWNIIIPTDISNFLRPLSKLPMG